MLGPPFRRLLCWALLRRGGLGWLRRIGCSLRCSRRHVHDPAAAPPTKLDMPRDQGEQRVVATAADAVAGVEVRAALPDNDLAGVHQLAAKPLDAQPLSIRVPTVARRGCALLVCHIVASA